MTERSFKEILLLLLSAILFVAIIPFAIFRFRAEQWQAALFDSSVICVMLGLFLHVYFNRETRGPGVVMALTFVAASLGSMHLLGSSQIYWIYPALSASFFLLETRQAAILSMLSIAATVALFWTEFTATTMLTVFLTLITSILFAYSFALTAKRQQSKLQRLATLDPLTGAGNRRAQNEKLDAANALFRRAQLPCSILILDIDHFKKVNDTYGHVVGDDILVGVADLIGAHTRPTENLYRYGGEEFIIVAENTELQGAAQLAEKLRELIDLHTFVSDIHITVSFGVAGLDRGEGRQGWLNRADAALFRAKGGGRNRIVLAEPSIRIRFVPHAMQAAQKN